MTGLQGELRDRILGAGRARLRVEARRPRLDYRKEVARLRALDGVVGAAPAILGKALLRPRSGDAFVTLKGIDPALEPEVTDLGRSMTWRATIEAIARCEADRRRESWLASIWRRSWALHGRRLGDGADARGHALADGHGCRARAGSASRASFGLACMNSTPPAALSRSRHGRAAARHAARPGRAARCPTSTQAPAIAERLAATLGPTTRRRTGPT